MLFSSCEPKKLFCLRDWMHIYSQLDYATQIRHQRIPVINKYYEKYEISANKTSTCMVLYILLVSYNDLLIRHRKYIDNLTASYVDTIDGDLDL